MITPRTTRLVRVPDLHTFRQAIVDLACEGPPLAARDRLVVVPTRAAAAYLLRSIEDRRLIADDSLVLPDIVTPGELIERLPDVEGVIVIEGIGAFIERIEAGTWAVVTSATRALAEVRMRAAKIPIPEVMITAENVQRGKPDPEGFLLAATRLGVSISDCLVFEDSPAGVAAAKAAGAHVAIVGGHVPEKEGHYAIENYL